jgi:hypothetical protein
VSIGIALPAVALLVSSRQGFFLSAIAVSLILLALARLIAPIPLPGLFLILVPTVMGLIFIGLVSQKRDV